MESVALQAGDEMILATATRFFINVSEFNNRLPSLRKNQQKMVQKIINLE